MEHVRLGGWWVEVEQGAGHLAKTEPVTVRGTYVALAVIRAVRPVRPPKLFSMSSKWGWCADNYMRARASRCQKRQIARRKSHIFSQNRFRQVFNKLSNFVKNTSTLVLLLLNHAKPFYVSFSLQNACYSKQSGHRGQFRNQTGCCSNQSEYLEIGPGTLFWIKSISDSAWHLVWFTLCHAKSVGRSKYGKRADPYV